MSVEQDIQLYNVAVEAAILSAIVFDNDALDDLADKLSPDDFYVPSHKDVYSIMLSLREDGKPIDEVFLIEELSKVNKASEEVMLNILSANPISNTDSYILMLKELKQKRLLYDMSLKIRKSLHDENDTQKILIDAMDSIEEAQDSVAILKQDRKMSHIVDEIRIDMEKAASGEEMPFFETGYPAFDTAIGGFVENGLTVVAGRPSMGKSSLTSGPIMKTLENGESAALYSMEVADKNALMRLVSFRSQEPLSNIKKGMVQNYQSFNEAMDFFAGQDDKLYIVDRSGMTRRELEIDIIKKLKKDPNLKLIVVDHLLQIQLDTNKHAPTELGEITKMLKRISQNYQITVVLLSQLNRSVESRDNKRPMMADLQGSGSIEQDADMIVFLYRSEYYKEKEWDQEKDGPYQRKDVEQAEVIIGKNRDGPTGSVELGFRAKTASFLKDYIPATITEYIDDDADFNSSNFGENSNQKGSVKEHDDIIDVQEGGISLIDMPPI